MEVILYSTGCPRCDILKKKLLAKNIIYKEVNNVDVMKEKGYFLVPVLVVNETVMDFKAANTWINSQGDK